MAGERSHRIHVILNVMNKLKRSLKKIPRNTGGSSRRKQRRAAHPVDVSG
jgi:hypothetical protein